MKKIRAYLELMRFHKPVGIFLLLWPTLWALWISAGGFPSFKILIIFIVGVILMRAAGCVVNDIADRKLDPHVARTRNRPLASGVVSLKEALLLLAVLYLCALILVLFLNTLSLKLAIVGALLSLAYPFSKRFIQLPQFILGLAFAWAIPMAFAAQGGELPPITWLLFSITVLWALIYDTEYAMVDREEDLKIGVYSSAILFGCYDRFWIAIFQFLMLALLLVLGVKRGLQWAYFVALFAVFLLMLYQQWLIRERKPVACFKAFLNNQWMGALIFVGIFMGC